MRRRSRARRSGYQDPELKARRLAGVASAGEESCAFERTWVLCKEPLRQRGKGTRSGGASDNAPSMLTSLQAGRTAGQGELRSETNRRFLNALAKESRARVQRHAARSGRATKCAP